jgi:hypothetical protein
LTAELVDSINQNFVWHKKLGVLLFEARLPAKASPVKHFSGYWHVASSNTISTMLMVADESWRS